MTLFELIQNKEKYIKEMGEDRYYLFLNALLKEQKKYRSVK